MARTLESLQDDLAMLTSAGIDESTAATLLLADAIHSLADSALRISHGSEYGPTGLELVAMSIAKSSQPSLVEAIGSLADSIVEAGAD